MKDDVYFQLSMEICAYDLYAKINEKNWYVYSAISNLSLIAEFQDEFPWNWVLINERGPDELEPWISKINFKYWDWEKLSRKINCSFIYAHPRFPWNMETVFRRNGFDGLF